MGQVGAADFAMPIRRGQLGAANSALGQFSAGPTQYRTVSGQYRPLLTLHQNVSVPIHLRCIVPTPNWHRRIGGDKLS